MVIQLLFRTGLVPERWGSGVRRIRWWLVAPPGRGGDRAPERKRNCILLWMNGGPSTIDLWDLKPGHANGGPVREIATKTPGLKISELLPKMAGWSDHHGDRPVHAHQGGRSRSRHLPA